MKTFDDTSAEVSISFLGIPSGGFVANRSPWGRSLIATKLTERAAAVASKIAGNTSKIAADAAEGRLTREACRVDLQEILSTLPADRMHYGKADRDRYAAAELGWRPLTWGARRVRMIRTEKAGASIILDFRKSFDAWMAKRQDAATASDCVSEREQSSERELIEALAGRIEQLEAALYAVTQAPGGDAARQTLRSSEECAGVQVSARCNLVRNG